MLIPYCVTFGKLLNFSRPQFPHPQNGENNSSNIVRLGVIIQGACMGWGSWNVSHIGRDDANSDLTLPGLMNLAKGIYYVLDKSYPFPLSLVV